MRLATLLIVLAAACSPDPSTVDEDGDGATADIDCDDTDPAVHPFAGEEPGDGLDQDCDGSDACRDLNCDGWPDLVFACTGDTSGDYHARSVIYWGSADGYDAERSQWLPTLGAMGATTADLDGDGWLEVIFAHVSDGDQRYVDSRIYWGGAEGFDAARVTDLPTVGAADVSAADVDADGWTDLLFSNRYNGGPAAEEDSYRVDSYLYWGGAEGFSEQHRQDIPTVGAGRAAIADLDGDGLLDLAFAHGTFHVDSSWVYLGADGFAQEGRVELPTYAPEGVQAADLDGDGWLDLVFANFYHHLDPAIDSTVYWGGPDGFDAERVERYFTRGATGSAVADLDGDGVNDLVFANSMADTLFDEDYAVDSTIYWGADPHRSSGLPTLSASEVAAADLNRDGWTDLVFSNHYDATGGAESLSYVYWGSPDGFADTRRDELPTVTAAGLAVAWPTD